VKKLIAFVLVAAFLVTASVGCGGGTSSKKADGGGSAAGSAK